MDEPSTSKNANSEDQRPKRWQQKKMYTPEQAVELLFSGELSDMEFEDDSESDESEDEELPAEEPDHDHHDGAIDPDTWTWVDDGDLVQIDYTGAQIPLNIENTNEPSEYFNLLATNEFYDLVLSHTNKYAEEIFLKGVEEHSRMTLWKDLTHSELKIFLGLLYHTGTIKLSRIEDYWKTSYLFNIPVFRQFMSRNRFQGILRALHFANNPLDEQPAPEDRLYKIRPLFDFFNRRMEEIYYPGRNLSLDESMVLWRGRLVFRQYIKNKRHKYGVKLYMLCEPTGMIQKILVYTGAKDTDIGGKGHTANVVHKLLENKFNKGHALYMDNFYNDIGLARDLLTKGTYVTGTLRKNRKNIPPEILSKKLAKGELVSKYANGVSIQKWKDKRDILMISTEHKAELIDCQNRRGQHKMKPKSIVKYNNYMSGIDMMDQMSSYYSCERKTLRWNQKLGIHVFQCMLLNAYFLYTKNSTGNLSLYDFRLKVIDYLLSHHEKETNQTPKRKSTNHCPQTIKKVNNNGAQRSVRRKCKLCLSKKIRKDTMYCCLECECQPALCLDCFPVYHNSK